MMVYNFLGNLVVLNLLLSSDTCTRTSRMAISTVDENTTPPVLFSSHKSVGSFFLQKLASAEREKKRDIHLICFLPPLFAIMIASRRKKSHQAVISACVSAAFP